MIAVDRRTGGYTPPPYPLLVGHRDGQVVLTMGGKRMTIGTTTAIDVCLSLGRMAVKLEPGEHLVLILDGYEIPLPFEAAVTVSGALLRKADAADDWQLACGLSPFRGTLTRQGSIH